MKRDDNFIFYLSQSQIKANKDKVRKTVKYLEEFVCLLQGPTILTLY